MVEEQLAEGTLMPASSMQGSGQDGRLHQPSASLSAWSLCSEE